MVLSSGPAGGFAMGRLSGASDAPAQGEHKAVLARAPGFAVEEILSGELESAASYVQDHDEWVVLLEGRATLEVDGAVHELRAGDWVLLPAGLPHRLVRTEPGTRWLAVLSDPES